MLENNTVSHGEEGGIIQAGPPSEPGFLISFPERSLQNPQRNRLSVLNLRSWEIPKMSSVLTKASGLQRADLARLTRLSLLYDSFLSLGDSQDNYHRNNLFMDFPLAHAAKAIQNKRNMRDPEELGSWLARWVGRHIGRWVAGQVGEGSGWVP